MWRVLWQKKSTPSAAERSDPVCLPSGGRSGKEGGKGGIRILPSQCSGLSAESVSLNSSPVSVVPDPEFGVASSRSLQYLRELPDGMCGIHVMCLMHENWFLRSLLWCLR